jgi:uncharacterized protein (DUF2141 family)
MYMKEAFMNGSAALGLASFLAASLLGTSPGLADSPPSTFAFSVRLTNLRNNKGKVGCSLYSGPRGFPKDAAAAIQNRWCPIDGSSSTCRFDPIAQGTYAVACFHDENGNGKLDTGLFGIPIEGTVVSNRAKGSLGPPKYDDAKFAFTGQGEMVLPMSY